MNIATDTATPPTPVHRKLSFKRKLMIAIVALFMIAFLRTGFVFFIIGMLPSVVAYYLDRSEEHYTFRTIFACNLSGMLPFLGRLMFYGPNKGALYEITGSINVWVIIYGASLVGLMLTRITPILSQMFIGGLHNTQVQHLQRAQSKIEKEWGKEVTQFNQPDEPEL